MRETSAAVRLGLSALILPLLVHAAAAFGEESAAVGDLLADRGAYPDPRRFESEIRAFADEDRAFPPPKGALLCVGSSSIRMWHSTIREDLAPSTVIPRGFGGSTMLDLLYYASRIVVPYEPRAILVYEGDNDIAEGVSPETIRLLFDALVLKVRSALPETRIYLLSIKPSPARWHLWDRMKEANRLLRSACDADERLCFIDVAARMLDEKGNPRAELFLEDGLHLNGAGYALWRDEVRAILDEERSAR